MSFWAAQSGSCEARLFLQRLGCPHLLCQHALYKLPEHLMAVLLLPSLHTCPLHLLPCRGLGGRHRHRQLPESFQTLLIYNAESAYARHGGSPLQSGISWKHCQGLLLSLNCFDAGIQWCRGCDQKRDNTYASDADCAYLELRGDLTDGSQQAAGAEHGVARAL